MFDDFGFAAFLQCGDDGVLKFHYVHGFGNAVMRAARALEGFELLGDFEGAGDDDDGDVRQEVAEFGEEIEALFAVVQNMVEDDEVGRIFGHEREGIGAGRGAGEFKFGEAFFVNLVLQIIVFDDQDFFGLFHGYGDTLCFMRGKFQGVCGQRRRGEGS